MVQVLRGVDLELPRGQVLGLMGPNGAGKSTLLRLLAGLLIPDSGQLTVLGQQVQHAGVGFRRRVCYVVPDERSFSWRLTALQNLDFFASLYGLTGAPRRQRVERALELVGLTQDASRTVREFSSGMRQRLSLARGFLGDPELFLLDEPTRGLDPDAARELRQFLRGEVLDQGITALVATHDPTEAETLCDGVVRLRQGRLAELAS